MENIIFKPIGFIRTPFTSREGIPIQSNRAPDVEGEVELYEEYADGLSDLKDFSHIILLYHLHLSKDFKLKVIPFLDSVERGLFSTRAPRRPNNIGLSLTEVVSVDRNIIKIRGIDVIDGTPLLDIKPYVPFFDDPEKEIRVGWLKGKKEVSSKNKSDGRFLER